MILATVAKALRSTGVITGNVQSNLQFATFIRPANCTECNGRTFPVGSLQAADLRAFEGAKARKFITDETLKLAAQLANQYTTNAMGVVLSLIYYTNEDGRSAPLGVIIYTMPKNAGSLGWSEQDAKILHTSFMTRTRKQEDTLIVIRRELENKLASDVKRFADSRHSANAHVAEYHIERGRRALRTLH